MSVTATGEGIAAIFAALEQLTKTDVMVGIPHGEARSDGLTNAEIGYVQETGSPINNIPARPFLVPGVEAVQDQIADRLGKAVAAALDGSPAGVVRQLNAAGMIAQNSVRATINSGEFEPLALSTIRKRARKGRKGAKKYLKQLSDGQEPPDAGLVKPLIDTGQLRNSITYVLRDKE